MGNQTIIISDQVILFTDIHDYSIIVHKLGVQHYTFLQEMYERLGDIIVAYQGEILKYMGDAMLCLFPAGSENDVVRCCIECRQAFDGLVQRHNVRHETELETGIGSGAVAVGVFGHRSLRQKDVFGEEVNRAAVIGHHRGIAVTENVYHKVKSTYQTSRLPDKTVKWLAEPLKVWEIVEK